MSVQMNAWAPTRFFVLREATCPECQGFGEAPTHGNRLERCPRCKGKGRVREEVALEEALVELGLLAPTSGKGGKRHG